jgi:hypothetical protein
VQDRERSRLRDADAGGELTGRAGGHDGESVTRVRAGNWKENADSEGRYAARAELVDVAEPRDCDIDICRSELCLHCKRVQLHVGLLLSF